MEIALGLGSSFSCVFSSCQWFNESQTAFWRNWAVNSRLVQFGLNSVMKGRHGSCVNDVFGFLEPTHARSWRKCYVS